MSDPKARHIQSTLADAILLEPDTDTDAPVASVHKNSEEGSEQGSNAGFRTYSNTHSGGVLNTEAWDEASARPEDETAWEREAERARQDILALLTCPPAPNFRARLLRELVRFAAGMPVWKTVLSGMGDKDQERALRRLRKLQDSLADTRPAPDVDRKTQARLAEDLAEASDRLYALSGQPEPARRPEDTHD